MFGSLLLASWAFHLGESTSGRVLPNTIDLPAQSLCSASNCHECLNTGITEVRSTTSPPNHPLRCFPEILFLLHVSSFGEWFRWDLRSCKRNGDTVSRWKLHCLRFWLSKSLSELVGLFLDLLLAVLCSWSGPSSVGNQRRDLSSRDPRNSRRCSGYGELADEFRRLSVFSDH